jgi:CRISPR-associated protein Cmr4
MTMTASTHLNARLFFIHTRSPLHMGCGDAVGYVDKPTLRNKVTKRPMVTGSAIKGRLKAHATGQWGINGQPLGLASEQAVFGKDGDDGTGMLCPQDAHLLLLPVACWAGGWAWVTSPAVLHQFKRAVQTCALPDLTLDLPAAPNLTSSETAWVSPANPLITAHGNHGQRLVLLDEVLMPQQHADAAAWASWIINLALPNETNEWKAEIKSRFAVVSNVVFDRLCEVALDVRARNKIGDDGTAQDHHLWREECVPESALFFGCFTAQNVANGAGLTDAQVLDLPQRLPLRLGGKASVGYGCCDFEPVPGPTAVAAAPSTPTGVMA